jgi:hypothetical protein
MRKVLDKRLIIFLIPCLLILLFDVYIFFNYKALRAEIEVFEKRLYEMKELSGEFLNIKKRLDYYRQRVYKKKDPPSVALEEVLQSIGLKDRVLLIKPLPLRNSGSFKLYPFEVKLKKVTISELVRLLYHIDSEDRNFIVRNLRLSREFSSPQRLSVVAELVALETVEDR